MTILGGILEKLDKSFGDVGSGVMQVQGNSKMIFVKNNIQNGLQFGQFFHKIFRLLFETWTIVFDRDNKDFSMEFGQFSRVQVHFFAELFGQPRISK